MGYMFGGSVLLETTRFDIYDWCFFLLPRRAPMETQFSGQRSMIDSLWVEFHLK